MGAVLQKENSPWNKVRTIAAIASTFQKASSIDLRGMSASLFTRPLCRFCNPVIASRLCSTEASQLTAQSKSRIRAKLEKSVESYEDLIGIAAVRSAQSEVMLWEERLSNAQMARRDMQAELKGIQARLKEIHLDLDRTSRGEDRYLHLLTEEHAAIKKERAIMQDFEHLENAEREAFYQLSNRVRASHEKERERAEKTKWWSVSASLMGALIGIIGASIGNELRMRKLREMLPLGSTQMSDMAKLVEEQNEKVTNFINTMQDVLHVNVSTGSDPVRHPSSTEDLDKVLAAIKEDNSRLSAQMNELSRLARLEASLDADPNAVVYVGSEMEHLLEQTERNLESKMKLQTLLSVVFLYAAIGVTVPLAFAFFRGG